jgi:hypothetical protein
MKVHDTSERHQNNTLKVMIAYAKFFGPTTTFYQIVNKKLITSFLDTKIKNVHEDPDKRWITTWNHYLVLENPDNVSSGTVASFFNNESPEFIGIGGALSAYSNEVLVLYSIKNQYLLAVSTGWGRMCSLHQEQNKIEVE